MQVGPLDCAENLIYNRVVLIAVDLNRYFSSVFTREDISSVPKFQEAKSDYLGKLMVTPWLLRK